MGTVADRGVEAMSTTPELEYARPKLLAEPDWLWEHRHDPGVRVLDCGSQDAYARAHIPCAVALSVDGWLKEPEGGVHVMRAGDVCRAHRSSRCI